MLGRTESFGGEAAEVSADLREISQRSRPARPYANSRLRKVWVLGLVLLVADLSAWAVLYEGVQWTRTYLIGSPGLVSFSAVLLPLILTLCALATVDGYSERTEFSGLTYASEHLISCVVGIMVGTLFVYVFASFDASQHPSRAVIWVTGAIFGVSSLVYRWALSRVATSDRQPAKFLVVGVNEKARYFYSYYGRSYKPGTLEFVDVTGERIGQHLDGPSTPLIEGGMRTATRSEVWI